MTLAEYKSTHDGEFKQTNLVFLRREGQILLAMKKRGFGAGRWNGAGGKLEPGETFEAAARREVSEELGVEPVELTEVATLKFYWAIAEHVMKNVICVVYECETWTGVPRETEEMAPQWFAEVEIPYCEMWADDEYWLPRVLAGDYIEAELLFGPNDELLDKLVASRPHG
jgi:8-oxo-dGTP pyrophosphatase MutT (NUDIX family)